ncbi:calcium-binding protein [Halomonas sp. 328]|uniref:calcium-binding protein n=1 Tax=Halomonas sp. 328 TaxID=2776704 RepID=UPI0018A7994C|nr:calcium-binding protein [Halomonas sp. 328]MBF8223660.1 calcium-binding protein [Halomonas sp. 328]
MAMFDYKNYSTEESVELMLTTHQLATYANMSGIFGLPSREVTQFVADMLPDGIYANRIDTELPSGWRELTPAELGLPDSAVDFSGHYIIESPLTGTLATGPQAKLLGEFDAEGAVSRLAISFTGTNSPVDIVDYLQINEGTIAPYMEPLLQAVRDFSQAHGLSGSDTLVTGYSLGGGMTNIMARFREGLADGFFEEAVYIGHASPLIYNDPSVVLNFGYENDAVHRVAGDAEAFREALDNAGDFLTNPNTSYAASIDNVVLFNDAYALPNMPLPAYSFLNLPVSWYAHIDGVFTDAIERIADSAFYEYMHRDSVVVVSNLTALSRSTTWVEDKATATSNHHGAPAFLIGTEHNDLIRGGQGSDYIYAGGGDDLIWLSGGADRVDGGSGVNTLRLQGAADNWEAYRLSDGTLFLDSRQGLGMKQVENIDYIEFAGHTLIDGVSLVNHRYAVGDDGLVDKSFKLLGFLNRDIEYREHVEGTSGSETLSGEAVFGGVGNDKLIAVDSGSLLHGGDGDDLLIGGLGDDHLYGGEGDDTLVVRGGNDVLYGGIGDDRFVFEEEYRGSATIKDFHHHAGDRDWLVFMGELFADRDDMLASANQVGDDVVIARGDLNIVIERTGIDTVSEYSLFGA